MADRESVTSAGDTDHGLVEWTRRGKPAFWVAQTDPEGDTYVYVDYDRRDDHGLSSVS